MELLSSSCCCHNVDAAVDRVSTTQVLSAAVFANTPEPIEAEDWPLAEEPIATTAEPCTSLLVDSPPREENSAEGALDEPAVQLNSSVTFSLSTEERIRIPAVDVAQHNCDGSSPSSHAESPLDRVSVMTPHTSATGFTSSVTAEGEGSGTDTAKKRSFFSKVRKSFRRITTRSVGSKSSRHKPNLAPAGRVRIKTGNANLPANYAWLEAPLRSIASNKAGDLGCVDSQSNKAFTPLFFVIGGCPNYFCGMQVIAYFVSSGGDGEVDFWWVKPMKGSDTQTESQTLNRHAKGPHKNDPGRSKPFYKPLADMLSSGHVAQDGRRFSIEAPPGETHLRAFIEEDSCSKEGRREKLWLQMVWQEDWTSNPFSSSKYIRGKLVYQRRPAEMEFFAREYCIKDGVFTLSVFEDPPFSTILPDDVIKELYEGET